jgi:hypothetical protein
VKTVARARTAAREDRGERGLVKSVRRAPSRRQPTRLPTARILRPEQGCRTARPGPLRA